MPPNLEAKVGLIGCGWAGTRIYLPILARFDSITEVVACDADPAKAEGLRRFSKVKRFFCRPEQLLALADVSFVIIATPTFTHPSLARKALLAGKHVYTEKPLALTAKTSRELARCARKSGLLLRMASPSLHRPEIGALVQCAKGAILGKVYHLEARWWRRNGVPIRAGWRMESGCPGSGVLYDLGPHLLDVAFAVAGLERIRFVSAGAWCLHGKNSTARADWFGGGQFQPYTVEDRIFAHLVTRSGTSVCVDTAWAEEVEGDQTRFALHGTLARAELTTTFGYSPHRVSCYATLAVTSKPAGQQTQSFECTPEVALEAAQASLEQFILDVKERKSDESELQRAIHVTTALEKIMRSCRNSLAPIKISDRSFECEVREKAGAFA